MFKYRVVFRRFEPHSVGCQRKMEKSSRDYSLTESYLLNVTLVLCGRVHWVQGAQNMPEDGTTRVKGKQAKVWNGASLSDHLSAHCHHSFSFFGSRTIDFAVSDLYSSSKQITAASHENSECISTPAALPVQSDQRSQ